VQQRRKLTWVLVLAGLSVFGLNGCDDTTYETYTATLDHAQENPPTNSTATGTAKLLISQNGTRADLTVTLTNPLMGNLTAAHIHRAARGTNGGVIHNIWVTNVTTTEPFEVGSPIGRTFTFTEANLADLRAGNYYVNVHSNRNPGGEIRGQLVRD
jgi:hypothetical protein